MYNQEKFYKYRKMKALIVEDNEEIVSFVKKGLQFENFLVDAAEDGKVALSKIQTNSYDILIIDLLLPKIDGVELLKTIRESGVNTPAIVLTAIHDGETKVKVLNLGADDYLEKPFSFTELLARIKAILRRAKTVPKNEVYQLDDLVVDPSTRETRRAGKLLKLRRKEFDLLEYLIRHKGEVINQTVIMEKVWDFNSNALSNTVGAHISSLRRKIDGSARNKLIKTIHGVGYKISA